MTRDPSSVMQHRGGGDGDEALEGGSLCPRVLYHASLLFHTGSERLSIAPQFSVDSCIWAKAMRFEVSPSRLLLLLVKPAYSINSKGASRTR